ncbi:thioesterase family protein [Camelimonas abortus]|uniref:Thioesterase family protein n=1 Tax=Camelimonas abortus TaxID=1017184 RepID=A0ABV7LDK7_9HYPH
MEAVFRVEGGREAGRVIASAHAGGPWDPSMQHGGAPSAFAIWAAEQVETPVPMNVARLTMELMRPAPVGELEYAVTVLRSGRKIQLVQVLLRAGGHEVARAHVMKVRAASVTLPDYVDMAQLALKAPPPEECRDPSPGIGVNNPFVRCMTLKLAKGGFEELGPASVWFRADRPVVEGHATTPAMLAAIAGDFCNGVASSLDFSKWTYINSDLTLSLLRPPEGDWVLVDGHAEFGDSGAGLAVGRLADRRGYFGRTLQSLVVEPR